MHSIIISISVALLHSLSSIGQEVYHYNAIAQDADTEADLMQLLDANPDDEKANYNLAILHYNHAIKMIEEMDYDGTFEERSKIQDQVTDVFNKALPYAEKAHEINPDKPETIKMLSGIHFGLNGMDKSKYYESLYTEKTK